MSTREIRSRLRCLRAEYAALARSIAALEKLESLRLAPVVELVPHDLVLAELRRLGAWESPCVAA